MPNSDIPCTYRTLAEPGQAEFKDKGSRFIAFAYPVRTAAEVKSHVDALRQEHHKARHWCYAYRLGTDGLQFRANDDGEPAGSAGRPILGQIDSFGLTDVLVVVVRYFGGIKLGASGLVRAYTDAVAQTLDAASFDSRERVRVGVVAASHADAGRLENEMRACGLNILGTDYLADGAQISMGVFDRTEDLERANEQVVTITAGAGTVLWGDTRWVDIPFN